MNLSALLSLLPSVPEYRSLVDQIRPGEGGARTAVTASARPFLVASLHRDLRKPFLLVAADAEAARKTYDQLLGWCAEESEVIFFPSPESLPYERLVLDPSLTAERLKPLSLLAALKSGRNGETEALAKVPLVVTSAVALLHRTMPVADLVSCFQRISLGMRLNLRNAMVQWYRMGYELEQRVEVPGTMAQRGGIVDIYSPGALLPARIELLGDRVDSIRLFDPTDQRSVQKVDYVDINPASEFVSTEGTLDRLRQRAASLDFTGCQPEQADRIRGEVASILKGQRLPCMEFYLPLAGGGCLFDYLPDGSVLVLDEPWVIEEEMERLENQASQMQQDQEKAGSLPLGLPPAYLGKEEMAWLGKTTPRLSLESQQWEGPRAEPFAAISPLPGSSVQLDGFLRRVKESLQGGARALVVSQQAQRLAELFDSAGIIASPSSDVAKEPSPGSLTLVQGSLPGGWSLRSETGITLLFTDLEVFGFIKQPRRTRGRRMRRPVFLPDLATGDYVTHIEHGVARFTGVARMSLNGGWKEYLILEYAAGDKLYVPSDQVDRVSRYVGSTGEPPTLTRLGTQEWDHTRARVKRAVDLMARELLELYASREMVPGFAFSPDSPWQQELEASFPYVETADQLEAIQQVKKGMESARPMDRLICGDVGYGKTEVALRGAFKAVTNGKQVAFLVPTTVLAQQHFETFRERLGAYPVKVEVLSRFRSEAEQRLIIKGLADGTIDICVGTHRLLQQDVVFKNLALVIIDEEHRFGVAHKERLKQMRREVDIISLSATPIPRTLYMCLAGIRDMSVIQTPPESRLPIETAIAEYDDLLIRRAISRELERKGQVFFVHNRVRSLSRVVRELRALVPEARVSIAHGQMPSDELEAAMADFYAGKSDVLACTTIIESGLDMPNVNTLIVNRADSMGLTQLYQLRGRVGRGSAKAYAYFLVDEGKNITPLARKRLQTIFEASELGAGFHIAMRDLEIRGAGNILGPEQSGNIAAVGFDLYSRMLGEAVDTMRKGKGENIEVGRIVQQSILPEALPSVELPIDALIPQGYISDLSSRLAMYKHLTEVRDVAEVDSVEEELRDRFGQIPAQVRNLLYVVRFRVLSMKTGVGSLLAEDGKVVIRLGSREGKSLLPPGWHPAGDGIEVGLSQIRLDMHTPGKDWKETLLKILMRLPPILS